MSSSLLSVGARRPLPLSLWLVSIVVIFPALTLAAIILSADIVGTTGIVLMKIPKAGSSIPLCPTDSAMFVSVSLRWP